MKNSSDKSFSDQEIDTVLDKVLSPSTDKIYSNSVRDFSEKDIDSALDSVLSTNESQLRTNIYSSLSIPPEEATKQYQISKQTNVPIEVVRTHQSDITQMTEFNAIDFTNLQNNFPALTKQLEDPAKGAAIRDDIDNLSYLEKISQSWKSGAASVDIGLLGVKQLIGDQLSEIEKNRLNLASRVPEPFNYNWYNPAGIPIAIAQTLPAWLHSAKAAAIAATPFAVGGLPAYTAAFGTGVLVDIGIQEAGSAYNEFSQIRDNKGNAIDDDIIKGASIAVGGINGAIERLGLGSIVSKFPGGDKLIAGLGKEAIKERLKSGIGLEAFKRLGKAAMQSATAEGVTEGLQETTNIVFGELAKAASKGDFQPFGIKGEDSSGVLDFFTTAASRIGQATTIGVQAGFGLGGLGAGISIAYDRTRARQQGDIEQKTISDAIAGTKNSKTFKRDPSLFEEVTANSLGEQNVYIPADRVQEYFQSNDRSAEKFFKIVPEAASQIQEAIDAGGNLVLPANKVISALAQDESFAGLQEFMRLTPESINNEEYADVFFNNIVPEVNSEELKNEIYQKSEQIQKNIEEQVTKAGFTPETSRLYANAFRSFYETQSARLKDNEEAKQILNQTFNNLKIESSLSSQIKQNTFNDSEGLEEEIKKETGYYPDKIRMARESAKVVKKIDGKDLSISAVIDNGILGNARTGFVFAFLDGSKVAEVKFSRKGKGIKIYQIEVDSKFRRKGIASEIVKNLRDQFSEITINGAGSETAEKFWNTQLLSYQQGQEHGSSFNQDNIKFPSPRGQTETEAFKKWFGDSRVVDKDGKPLIVYHGSTNDIEAFSKEKANPGSDIGIGFYFSNSKEDVANNYSKEGPDLTSKIAQHIKENQEMNPVDAIQDARKQFSQNEGTTYPVYLSIQNPVTLGGDNETIFNQNDFTKLENAIRDVSSELNKVDADKLINNIAEITDGEEFSASRLQKIFRDSKGANNVEDKKGRLATGEFFRRVIEKLGFDGVIDNTVNEKFGTGRPSGDGMIGMNENTIHYIAFKPNQIKSTFNRGTFESGDPRILFQDKDQERGSITFDGPDGKTIIKLFEGRDLSTLLHESGHFFLETQKAIANLPTTSEQIKQDWQSTLNWLGSKDGNLTTEQHEQFARGFEAYLYKGEAPSIELRDTFRRFKTWLLRIYRDIKNLNVRVSKEMSGIFDRMLATDEQIETLKINPLFKPDPKISEMLTSAEREDYIKRNEKALELAKDKLMNKLLKQKERELKRSWKEEQDKTKEEITTNFNKLPVYRVIHWLKTGKLLDQDTPKNLKPFKINKKAIEDRFDPEIIKQLPSDILSNDGAAPEMIADMFDFSSADEMLKAIINAPNKQDEIDKAVDASMISKHGNLLEDGSLENEALELMHNQDRASQIAFEMDVISRKVNGIRASKEQFKIKAKEIIDDKKLDQAIKSSQYYSAEVKAAIETGKALGKKDYEKAAEWKRKQLLNHYLFQESLKAREDTEKALRKFKKYYKPQIKNKVKIDEDYRQKIIEILDNYNLGARISEKRENRLTAEALDNWMKEKEKDDEAIFVRPQELIDTENKTHYRDMTMNEFRGLYDLVENIAIQGANLRTIEIEGKKQDLQKIGEILSENINKNIPKSKEKIPRGQEEGVTGSFLRRFAISLIKARTLIREMDGFKDLGPAYTYLMDQIDSAEINRVNRLRKSANDVQDIFKKNYNKKNTGLSKQLIFIPEISESWTKEAIITAALNYGNLDSRTKLLEGENLNDIQMQAILSNLTEKDWNFVQDVWDYVNTFWSEKEALDKKRYGIAFTKVEPAPFNITTRDNQAINLKGGYYPLKYDYSRQKGSEKNFIKEPSIDELFSKRRNYSAQTKRSSSNERINGVKIPIRLNITPLFEHLNEVITDITMDEAITNSYKILNNKEVRSAIIDKMGSDTYTQLELWLKDLAIGGVRSAAPFEKALNSLRSGVTISVMGFKVATALIQLTGFTQTIEKLGIKYALKGLLKFLGNGNPMDINKNVHAVFEESKIMKQRSTTFHREIYEVQKNLQGKSQFKNQLANVAFYPIVKMQMMVDIPTWLGAYEKGIDQFNGDEEKAVKYADTQVIQAQGSGLMKDLSGFERGTISSETRLSPLVKLWTVFYSYFNTKLNLAYESLNRTDFKKPKDIVKLMTDMLLLFWVEAVIGEYLMGREPDFEEDDKDPLWWNIKLALSNIAATIPLLKEIASGLQGFSSSPASLRGLEEISRLGKVTLKTTQNIIEEEEVDLDETIKALNSAGGILFKYPSSQINVVLNALEKANQGEDVKPIDYLIYKK